MRHRIWGMVMMVNVVMGSVAWGAPLEPSAEPDGGAAPYAEAAPEARPCDVDENGQCDEADLDVCQAAHGACQGDPAYQARCDADGDGCIMEPDFALLGLGDQLGEEHQGAAQE